MQSFTNLHRQDKPLIIANVWDVTSAKIAQKLGFEAIGTSSMAIAQNLGYDDGEHMRFTELLYIVKRITQCVQTPLTVDLEAGYSRPPKIVVQNIVSLAECGVVGINIEDSLVRNNHRALQNLSDFTNFITQLLTLIRNHEQALVRDMFINIRTDTFLLINDNPLEQALERITALNILDINGFLFPALLK